MLIVNNKDTRKTAMTSFWSLYCSHRRYFTPCSFVSIDNFGQVNAGWIVTPKEHRKKYFQTLKNSFY